MLRPGYLVTSRKMLGGELLEQVHNKMISKGKDELAGREVTLTQDGWSDIHNSPVIATSIHSRGKSYFLSAVSRK